VNKKNPTRIHVVRESEILPFDRENQRLWRSGYIAQLLSESGYDVFWWTKSFDHYNKKQRKSKSTYYKNITIKIIKGFGYKKNLSIKRLFSEFIWSVTFFLKAIFIFKKDDIIFCSMPTITSSYACALISKIHGSKLTLDLRDQWPEIFKNTIIGKTLIGRIFIKILEKMLIFSANQSFKIYSVNEHYGKWLSNISKKNIDVEFLPMTYPLDLQKIKPINTPNFYKKAESVKLVFVGSLNDMMDLEWINSTIQKIDNYEFIIAGDGQKKSEWEEYLLSRNPEIKFIGHLDSTNLSYLMNEADIGLAPYKSIENFYGHVPNKIPEYLAHNLKIIGTLEGTYYQKLERLNFYINLNKTNINLKKFICHINKLEEIDELNSIIDMRSNYMKIINDFAGHENKKSNND
jgi:glycosyltransferase involved in cell wall biosynthesis